MQILGRADRLVGLVILGEGDLDLLDKLGLGYARIGAAPRDIGTGLVAPQAQLAPQRKFLLNRKEHFVLAWPAGPVDFVGGDAQRRIGKRARDRDPCLGGFGIERPRRKLGAETPGDRQYLLQRGRAVTPGDDWRTPGAERLSMAVIPCLSPFLL